MTAAYSIADCLFRINLQEESEKFELFRADGEKCRAEITVGEFSAVGSASFGVEYVSKSFEHFMRSRSNPSSILFSNADWSKSFVCKGSGGEVSDELMIAAVYSVLCSFKTLLLHASAVDYNGRGIVFVGPSGIGKTTQAELWRDFLGADIINGDKVFLKAEREGLFACGSPWKGSSPYCLNRRAEVKAVVVLRQSKVNRIRRLTAEQAMEYFVPHVFLPHWDEHCMSEALETLDEVLERLPIVLLECRADEEAVEITKNLVLGE